MSESQIQAEDRYLALWRRLTPAQYIAERQSCIDWSMARFTELDEAETRALILVSTTDLPANMRAVVTERCYADLPPQRRYDIVFSLLEPALFVRTPAVLRAGILDRRQPVENFEEGRHYLAMLEFPRGVPALFDTLPSGPLAAPWLIGIGLCDGADWPQIRAQQPRAPLWEEDCCRR